MHADVQQVVHHNPYIASCVSERPKLITQWGHLSFSSHCVPISYREFADRGVYHKYQVYAAGVRDTSVIVRTP